MDVEMKDSSNEAEVKEKLRQIIDVTNPNFQAQVHQLASAIGMEEVDHPDPAVLLKAIVIYAENSLDQKATQSDTSKQPRIALDEIPLGIKSSGNPQSDAAIKILRLLNVEQLRRLQTQINILTAAVQKVTADPKTDHKLGKVGR